MSNESKRIGPNTFKVDASGNVDVSCVRPTDGGRLLVDGIRLDHADLDAIVDFLQKAARK